MGIVDKLTNLANGFRSIYGITDKYSLDDMVSGFNGLEAHDYVNHKPNETGSYSTDGTKAIKDFDIYRIVFDSTMQAGTYYLSAELKGKGTFTIYAYPIDKSYHQGHVDVNLTDEWKRYGFSFVCDGAMIPGAFIRVNSDHEAKNFDVRNWKLVRIK